MVSDWEEQARDAAAAISSPLLDLGIDRATGIVWNISGGKDLTLHEVNEAAEVIYDLVDDSALIIFGAVVNTTMQLADGEVAITLIATGFSPFSQSSVEEQRAPRAVAPPQAAPQMPPAQQQQEPSGWGISKRRAATEGGRSTIPSFCEEWVVKFEKIKIEDTDKS